MSRAAEFAEAMAAALAARLIDRPAFRRWPLVAEVADDGALRVMIGNRGGTVDVSREDALALRDWLTETYDDALAMVARVNLTHRTEDGHGQLP